MDRQRIFNESKEFLANQKERCYDNDEGRCMYRFKNNKCVVGNLIPDNKYVVDMDCGESVIEKNPLVIKVIEELYGKINSEDVNFLKRLQETHDNFWNFRMEKLDKLAELYGLENK